MMNKKWLVGLAALLAALLVAETVLAHRANNAETSYRRHTMKAATGHHKALHLLLDPAHRAPFVEQKQMHISALQRFFELLPGMFPKDGNYQDSDARPAIWREWDQFTALIEQGKAALLEMEQNPEIDAQYQAYRKLHDSCQSCHDAYRD